MHRHWNRALLCALAVVATGCPKPSEGRLDAMADLEEPALFEIVAEGAELPAPDHHLQLAREGLAEVERLQPARVVFDSLSEIRLLAQDPLHYRRQILALKQYFAGSDRTVLLLDDPSANADNHLESLAHGVIALERESPIYGGVRWRLEIAKLRGVKFRDGYHAYSIERGGLRVCPRLAAPAHSPSFAPGTLPTGVAKLDALLGGGVDWGTATLIVGPAGCGKSSLATQVILAGANAGQVGAMFTFEESPNTLFARAKSLEMPLQEQVDAGRVQVHRLDPAETSPGQFADDVRIAVERDNARVVVIDSLTGYLNAMPEERFLLNQLHELLIYLSHHGVVTILIATQHGIIGTDMASPIDVSYLADAVVMLRYFESAGRVRNAISIIKKRSGPHERTVRELALGPAGLVVGEPLHELQGVLTGVPTYSGRSAPLLGGLDGKSA